MGVTAELVIESKRTSILRDPVDRTHALSGVSSSEMQVTGSKSVSLPPDKFHEIGPILQGLGVRVQERRYRPWELIINLFRRDREINTTRIVVFDMRNNLVKSPNARAS